MSEDSPELEALAARVTYGVYWGVCGGRNLTSGRDLVGWDELSDRQQRAWLAAAVAARNVEPKTR